MLTLRLYQSLKFNKPVTKDKVNISPGGYELVFRNTGGKEKSVRFDFEDYEGYIDDKDPTLVHCMQKNPDYCTYPGMKKITKPMLSNIVSIEEWYIDLETVDPNEEEYRLVEITEANFVVIGEKSDKQFDVPKKLLETIMPNR